MLRTLCACTLTLGLVGGISAAEGNLRDNVGVGLGTMIFDGHDGLVSQVSAATTNASSGNQTFAITSGTSGAEDYDGEGEALDAIGDILAVEDRARFHAELQTNFGVIFDRSDVTSDLVTGRIYALKPGA